MRKIEKLKKIYNKIPRIECKGLCETSCAFIPMSDFEKKLITEKYGNDNFMRNPCPKLHNGKCSIYEDRPLVCRLYGVVSGLPCVYGCEPKKMLSCWGGYSLKNKVDKL